jgi:uncharacterized protein YbjT (DUF2867 family)
MSLLVIGATGTLGRQIVRRAIDEGYSVKCLVRNLRKAYFLKEWGAELIYGDLSLPETLPLTLKDITAVIDASTARPSDSYPALVNLKLKLESYIINSDLNYTIFYLAGFFQGLISQYAIPILEKQPVWTTSESNNVGYMDTQDIAKFALRSLSLEDCNKKKFSLVGTRSWTSEEIIELCERLSGQSASVTRIPTFVLSFLKNFTGFFEWGKNVSDRLAFSEVLTTGPSMTSDMSEVYRLFSFDPSDTYTLERYMQDYFGRILRRLKELTNEKDRTL